MSQESEESWLSRVTRDDVDKSLARCPDLQLSEEMISLVKELKEAQDSTGGVICCVARGVPAGWGEPCFDKLEAMLAHAMLSIPATKGFEIGSGFQGTHLRGSQHNDRFIWKPDKQHLGTETNRSGGVQGGISNGEEIVFRVAFKPPATIGQPQPTSTLTGEETILAAKGRHDPCVVPRAPAIVEAMAALVLADAGVAQLGRAASKLVV